jgi:hypothetical protein
MTILGKLAAYNIPSVSTWPLGVLYDKKPFSIAPMPATDGRREVVEAVLPKQ